MTAPVRKVVRPCPSRSRSPRPACCSCAHSAARSQIAAAFLEELAGDRVRVHSAGPEPGERVNPLVVQAMAEVGIDLTGRTPRQLTEHTVAASDIVVTASGADACATLPGQRHEDWPVDDVAARTWTACASYAPTSPSNASPPTSRPRPSRRRFLDRCASPSRRTGNSPEAAVTDSEGFGEQARVWPAPFRPSPT
ncbi:hypothetical protein ACFXKI_49945 [Streptomyces mirabilis]|uniref:arsenate reductase/protein-tyrosine-phosphatase family protein n=1 Tax=Streptomyces mirabilis TaxID=68239 RepID=UPI0036BF07F4